MANIFPNGINSLNKDPGIVGVLEMQSQARARGAQAGSQMATNFMQGRKMKQDAAIDERKMKLAEDEAAGKKRAVTQADVIAGYVLKGGLPPMFSDSAGVSSNEDDTAERDETGAPINMDATPVPGAVEGDVRPFPPGMSNSDKLKATVGAMQFQSQVLTAQAARNKAAMALDLNKSKVAIGDLTTSALKDRTIGTPQFKQSLFELGYRTPDVLADESFKNALQQHEAAFKIQQELTPKAAQDVLATAPLIERARAEGKPDVAAWLEATMPALKDTPQSLAKMEQGKTEFQNLVTEATFGGDWNANDEFLPQASHIASKYPGLAATDEYKNALAAREKAVSAKAPDDVLKWYLLANQAEAAGNQELAAGYRAKYQGQQFESDKVAERASTQVRGNLAEAIGHLAKFKASEFGFSNVGPLVPLVDVIDVGVALGDKVPVLGAGARAVWENIAGDPAKRGEMAARIQAMERMVSSAMGYEKNVSNVEGQKIARMLQAAQRATTPEKVVAAIKTVELILTRENAREHRRALENLDAGSHKMLGLMQDTAKAIQMLPKGDPESDTIKESIAELLNRKGVAAPRK